MALKQNWVRGDIYDEVAINNVATTINNIDAKTTSMVPSTLEVSHEFTKDANGAVPATADSGQTWTKTYNRIAAAPTIVSGRFVDSDTAAGNSAGYLTAQVTASSATYFKGDFDFGAAGSTNGHRAVIVAWATNLPTGVIGAIPDSPMHLVMGPSSFDFGVWSGGNLTIVGSHFYATAFTTATQHVEVVIDRSASTAYVLSPDGQEVSFKHSLIGSVTAPYASVEVFLGASNTDHAVRWQRWGAGTAMPGTASAGGAPPADSVGWTELIASGTGGTGKFLAIDASNNLSAAVPAGGGGTVTAGSGGITDAGATGIAVIQSATQAAARAAIGVGGAVVTAQYANVVDYGADTSGAADCVAAFRSAGNVTGSRFRPIFVPQGQYRMNSTVFTTGALDDISVTGPGGGYNTGLSAAVINQAPGIRFIDTAVTADSLTISGLLFQGGAGHFRWTSTAQAVQGLRTIEKCFFYGYSNASISCENQDSPYWRIHNCQWWAANCSTSMGIALAGWSDCSSINDCSFLLNRVHIKVGRMGPNTHMQNLDLLRFATPQGFPRVDIWFPPCITPSPIGMDDVGAFNAGVAGGIVLRDSKFGNEFYDPADYRVLIADEGAGALTGDRFPVTAANSTGLAGGITITNCAGYGTAGAVLVRSTTPNLSGMLIGPIYESGGTFPLLSLRNATGFNPALNIVGPIHTIGGINPTTMTVADSGTLTGQCKTMVVA